MSRCKTCVLALALVVCASPAFAGYLAGDTTAYFDGFKAWHGSTPFTNGSDLYGTVEWAVYAPGAFPASFTGYVPDPSKLTYTYQIFSEGPDPVSYLQVALNGQGSDAGFFTGSGPSSSVDGIAPLTSDVFSFVAAIWTFSGLAGDPGNSIVATSKGLVFSSPNVPIDGLGILQDGGNAGFAFPIPSTSPFFIPEPTTMTLAFGGLIGLAVAAWRRRRRVS